LGSLYTAAASYLDARAQAGRWLLRIEDLDRPRVIAGAATGILNTLQKFGFEWDGEVWWQSERTDCYRGAVDSLRARGLTFECSCSRSQLADDERYPGHCRASPRSPGGPTATRLRVDAASIQFTDRIQGTFRQDVAKAVGDFVLHRRDATYAYVLAVVVDDEAQGVTHVVRGADLLDNTPRQIHLQRLLSLTTPDYAHVPLLTEPDGRKLAKSARSVSVDSAAVKPQLQLVFELLRLFPPPDLLDGSIEDMWAWAIPLWNPTRLARALMHPLTA